MRLRSKPIRIESFHYPSGKTGYLVVGTVIPKQKPWREKFSDRAKAEERQTEWESDRMRLAAGMRMRATSLSNEVLRDAENAASVAKKMGFASLLDAVLAAGGPAREAKIQATTVSKTYRELFDLFVDFHKEHASWSQRGKVRQDATRFGNHIGWESKIDSITTQQIHSWVKAEADGGSKKTFNNVLNNVSRVFSWACAPLQGFLKENPAAPIPRYGKNVLAQGAKEILKVSQCVELMDHIEREHPQWIFPFALMLFAGVRPGYHDGEIRKFVRCANRDGIDTYILNGVISITAEIAKDRRPRKFHVPDNLAAWISRYCPKNGQFTLGSKESYAEIREKFAIPYDGLRHTAISAHVMKNGSFAMAAVEFGNSEKMIRDHYFSRMTKENADAFYRIMPTK